MSRDTAARSFSAATEINLVPSRRISLIKQNRLGRTTFLICRQKRFSMKLERALWRYKICVSFNKNSLSFYASTKRTVWTGGGEDCSKLQESNTKRDLKCVLYVSRTKCAFEQKKGLFLWVQVSIKCVIKPRELSSWTLCGKEWTSTLEIRIMWDFNKKVQVFWTGLIWGSYPRSVYHLQQTVALKRAVFYECDTWKDAKLYY